MMEYAYLTGDRSDPRWYENQPEQLDPQKATVWALHLHVDADEYHKIMKVAPNLPRITGEYTYGDSWLEWGEENKGDDDGHLVLYFDAYHDHADAVGSSIVSFLLSTINRPIPDYAVTTAGDYAEQAG